MKEHTFLKTLRAGALLVSVMLPNVAQAASMIPGYPDVVQGYDPREVAMLPSYCKYTQLFRDSVPGGNNSEEIKHWYARMGRTFHAMHHYCWGLMKTNRALFLARTKQIRTFYLDAAIQEYNYVLRSATEDFVLLPEILTKKGENLIRLGRGPLAIRELERAIGIKPDYWPPYAALSDYYKGTGNIPQAREVLEKGLSAAPTATPLKTRLTDLGRGGARPRTESPGAKSAPGNGPGVSGDPNSGTARPKAESPDAKSGTGDGPDVSGDTSSGTAK